MIKSEPIDPFTGLVLYGIKSSRLFNNRSKKEGIFMCGDSGVYASAPRLDDSVSIDDLVDERDYPGLTCKLRKQRVYTIGDLRKRDVRTNLTEWLGASYARALQEMMDDNDGREP